MSQQPAYQPVAPQPRVTPQTGVILPPKNSLALASLVLGIISIFASLVFVPAIVGIILGFLGLRRAGRTTPPVGKGKAITGLVLSAVGLLIGIGLVNAISGGGSAPDDASISIAQDAQTEHPAADAATEPSAETEEPAPAPVDPFIEEYGTFEPVTVSGTGKSVVTLPAGVEAAMVTAQHTGSRNFSLSVLDGNNQPTGDLLVNTIGTYSGVTAYGMNGLGTPVNLQVDADGQWTVTIAPLATAPEIVAPSQGTGDGVFRYLGGAAPWNITHSGSRNFAVFHYGGLFPDLMVNEIGAFQGTVPVTAGPAIVVISADGAWTIG